MGNRHAGSGIFVIKGKTEQGLRFLGLRLFGLQFSSLAMQFFSFLAFHSFFAGKLENRRSSLSGNEHRRAAFTRGNRKVRKNARLSADYNKRLMEVHERSWTGGIDQ